MNDQHNVEIAGDSDSDLNDPELETSQQDQHQEFPVPQVTEVKESCKVATLIRNQLDSLPTFSYARCIYKVADSIRKVKIECYQPSVIAIGPLFYDHPSLQGTHELKLRNLECFLEHESNAHSLEHYVEWVREREERIRMHYAETIDLTSDDFITLMLVDSVFIIYLFTWYWDGPEFSSGTHPINYKMDILSHLEHDLFLEENQVPYFVLEGIYTEAFGAAHPHVPFLDVTCATVAYLNVPGKEAAGETVKEKIRETPHFVQHLTDFLRICCLPTKPRIRKSCYNSDIVFPLTATELKAAGVKFVVAPSKNLLDIKFAEGILEIPQLHIEDNTESVFRSIIVFELCHSNPNSHFIDYMFFIDSLINTPKDVQILVKYGVIDNWLGSDEAVTNLFNGITRNITLCNPEFYYSDISRRLREYAQTPWNRWLAILRRDYFNHPWTIISVIYAVVLLGLTICQTISGFTSN